MGRLSALLLFVAAASLGADALVWGPAVGGRTSLVAGVVVEGKEVGVVEALATEQGVCLALEDFARLAGARWDGSKLSTPLGELSFTPQELLAVEGTLYLCPEWAQKRLGVGMLFDPQAVAVTLDLPWTLAAPPAPPAPLVPEVRPPSWGLGNLRADAWMVREGGRETQAGSLTLTGRVAQGQWRLLLERSGREETTLREFFWQRRWQRTSLGLGRSLVQLSPLLSGYDFFGAQMAWSNEPLPRREGPWGSSTSWVGALRTFRGPAPPGSLVKLKVDGLVVASQLVGLSGRYEFLEVPVSGQGALVVEVEIYDRHNLLVPQEVRREVVSGAFQLLPERRVLQVAGVGWGGFFGRKLLGEERQKAGFYALRWGFRPQATGQLLLQALGSSFQGSLGLAAAPVPWAFVNGEVAASREGRAFLLETQALGSGGEVTLRLRSQSQGFALLGPSAARQDRSLELRRFFGKFLELGLWARDLDISQQRFRWVRPTLGLSWGQWLFLRVMPDQQGDLWGVLLASPTPRLRFSAAVAGSQTYDLTYQLGAEGWQLRGTWEGGGGGASRVTATLGFRGPSWWAPAWRAGASHSGGRTAPYLEASARWGGLWLRAEYQGIPGRVRPGEPLRSRLYISLTADYSYASGLLTPTGHLPGLPQNGAVAGRLRVLGGAGGRSLAGARIVVVGAGGTTSDASGAFYVGGIPPGVYEVYLDTEKLPLELAPLHWRRVVEVQAGLTTRVDFTLEERFGFAGQVRNAQGEGVAQLTLLLVDKAGQEVARTATDAFGYFRFDQIPPGTYRLRAVSPQGQTLAERTVELREFLFGQDLQLP